MNRLCGSDVSLPALRFACGIGILPALLFDPMKNSDELMLIPHEEGFRAWRIRGGAVTPEGSTRRDAQWVAIPARNLISVPMRFAGVEASRQESMAQLEMEAAGFGQETADTTNYELWRVGKNDERDQRSIGFIQIAPLPPAILDDGEDAQFAPSVAFQNLQPGEALIWREAGAWVLAIPNESGGPLHCQALAARILDGDAAAEIRCILDALELNGLTPSVQSMVVQIAPHPTLEADAEDPEALPHAEAVTAGFEEALDIPVSVRQEHPPARPDHPFRLVPAPVVQRRQERQQRRMIMMGAAAFAFVLVAALGAFAARVGLRERSLTNETARLDALEPELMTIRDAQAAWADMRFAITPELYPVEALHQLVSLLPNENIRITRFEVREDGIVVDGESSSLGHGIDFRDKLIAHEAFKRWTWEFPQPTSLPDGRATFRAEGRPVDANTETPEGNPL